jgi:hypothetical protein
LEVIDNHNHPPHEEKILNKNELSNSLKRKATEDLRERPTKFIHQKLRGVLPKLPTTQEEVHHALNSHPIKTNRDEPFLLVNDAENKIIMFLSQTNLEFLCSSKFIYTVSQS